MGSDKDLEFSMGSDEHAVSWAAEMLGIHRAATIDEVNSAFDRLMQKLERDFGDGRITKEKFEQKKMEALMAYDVMEEKFLSELPRSFLDRLKSMGMELTWKAFALHIEGVQSYIHGLLHGLSQGFAGMSGVDVYNSYISKRGNPPRVLGKAADKARSMASRHRKRREFARRE